MLPHRFSTLLFTMLAFAACVTVSAQDKLSVQVIRATASEVNEQITLSGEVNALLSSRLSIETDGLVSHLYVDVGNHVKKGDTLLTLDNALATQSLKEADAAVTAAQAKYDDAKRLYQEAQRLLSDKHVAKSEIQSRKSRQNEANAALQQATAQRNFRQEVLNNHTLYAPFSGVISQKNVEVGEWHQTGSQVLQLVSFENVRVDVRVPQEVYPRLDNVKAITLLPDTAPDETIAGEIATIVPVGTTAGRSFLVRLTPKQTHPALIPGISVRATIQFKISQRAITVPRDALLRQPDGNVSAFVIENGTAKRRLLTLGGDGNYGVEVIDGLNEGDRVVIRGNEVLSEGQQVSVSTADNGAALQ